MKKIFTLFSIIILLHLRILSQPASYIDSLKRVIKNAKQDTVKINTMYELANAYYLTNTDTTIEICEKAVQIALKLNYKKGLCEGYGWLGYLQIQTCNIPKSSEYYKKSFEIYKELNDEKGMALCLHNLGYNVEQQGNIAEALNLYEKALKIREKINDLQGTAYSLNNLAYIYDMQGETEKSIAYNKRCLKIYIDIKDTIGIAYSLNNLGNIFDKIGEKEKGLEYYFKSLTLREKINAKKGIAESYLNIATLYKGLKKYNEAISHYNLGLSFFEEIGNKHGISFVFNHFGDLYYEIENLSKAKEYAFKSLKISKELGFPANIRNSANLLAKIFRKEKNYKDGWEYYELYVSMKDSIYNEETQKLTIKQNMRYEFEKQMAIDSIKHTKEIEIKDLKLAKSEQEKNKQKIIIYSFILGFLIILFFSILLYRMFVQKKKANILLAQKNIEVEQKNEEITSQRDEISAQRDLVTQQKNEIVYIHEELTDSINYAKRIQEAVLPISTESRLIMGEHFILFRPKDIVSGDFYWTAKVENTLIVAVADCTGHGVPGAFMSMLGISFLNEIVRKKEIIAANQVLNELRKEIINALQQKGQLGEQKDGMDISLIAISQLSKSFELLKSSKLYQAQWAGANNPLWLVRSSKNLQGFENLGGLSDENCQVKTHDRCSVGLGEDASANYAQQTTNNELFEFKPDKMPIAIYEKMDNFTNHELQLNSGDILYLMSDGYEDQFGGPKGKKFLSKNLKELIISNCLLTMEEQKQVLEKTLDEWIGGGEQIDDITILGIKI